MLTSTRFLAHGFLLSGKRPRHLTSLGRTSLYAVYMPDLITLTELRAAVGIDATDTRDNAKYTALIPYASSVITSYTGRNFTAPQVTESRSYRYDGSGAVDIDDATEITKVVLHWPNDPSIAEIELPARDWQAMPDLDSDTAVYEYISLPGYTGGATTGSPQMGFTRNLDVYARERGPNVMPPYVKVTGTFGWPTVPGDVKMATIWTVQEWIARPSGDALTSESIEGWSRAWGGRMGTGAALAVPARARDILASYTQVMV